MAQLCRSFPSRIALASIVTRHLESAFDIFVRILTRTSSSGKSARANPEHSTSTSNAFVDGGERAFQMSESSPTLDPAGGIREPLVPCDWRQDLLAGVPCLRDFFVYV